MGTNSTQHRHGRRIGRLAAVSLHTSPLAQPGVGDAGGMNVYVDRTARQLAAFGVEVDIFTRATSPDAPAVVSPIPGVRVLYVPAGPPAPVAKEDLPQILCEFAAAALRLGGGYDVLHSHYWLSGQAGQVMAAGWNVPHVHSAHTLALVKNSVVVPGASPEPAERIAGERQVIAAADRLVANTPAEAEALAGLYGASRARIDVVAPGVDGAVFRPGPAACARARLGVPLTESVIAFAGRIQPLKGPDVLVRALAELRARHPLRRWRLLLVGGSSGSGHGGTGWLRRVAQAAGVEVDLREQLPPGRLADIFRAADVVAVPSYQESFGLVALEAQASGTPVVAAAVGGLPTAIADGVTGTLVYGHDPAAWATAIEALVSNPDRLARMGAAAAARAAGFSWSVTARRLLRSYRAAVSGSAPGSPCGPGLAGAPCQAGAPGPAGAVASMARPSGGRRS